MNSRTRPVSVGELLPTSAELDRIVEHLQGGGLLGYPTETVYGVGGDPTQEVVEAIRQVKGRAEEKPFLLLLPGGDHVGGSAPRWGLEFPVEAQRLSDFFWPGPLTLVLGDPEGRFPPGVRSDSGGVAVRVSPHPFVESLMARWDRPLISTSANRAGEPAALTAGEVQTLVEGSPDRERVWIVEGGRVPSSIPSTVVDCTGERPRLLRRGAIPDAVLKMALPELLDD